MRELAGIHRDRLRIEEGVWPWEGFRCLCFYKFGTVVVKPLMVARAGYSRSHTIGKDAEWDIEMFANRP